MRLASKPRMSQARTRTSAWAATSSSAYAANTYTTRFASAGRAPAVPALVALGQSPDFAARFVERLAYLIRLREAGTLRAAGPFAGMREGMYLVHAADEAAARRVLEEDPLYRSGFIERAYTVQRWLVAI